MLGGGAAVLAAAAAGSEDAAGGEAGMGLGAGGTKGTSVLCSWLRWSPETLVELDIFDSRFSFEFRPANGKKKKEKKIQDVCKMTSVS